jgi:hypothetical protein
MRYLLTSNIDPSLVRSLPDDERDAVMARFISYTTALAESGVLRGAEHLLPADTATTVRNRDGETLLTDGPYADVVEAFGGYWIVESPDLDSALEHARACPAADVGSVEVRGIIERG